MKKWMIPVLLLGIAWLNVSLVYEKESDNRIAGKVKFTFVAPMANYGYWGQAALAVSEACKERGIDVKCVGSAKSDPVLQIQSIQSAIRSGADGIITTGLLDNEAFRNVLFEAKQADIPIVLIDSNAEDSAHLCYIGIDNFLAGQTAARLLADLTGEEGRIAVVASEIEKPNQAERLRGLKDGLEQYPDMEITAVLERGESIIALKDQITQLLDQNPQIDGLFCIEGYSSRAISLIMEEHPESYTQVHKVVFDLNDDTSQALQNGYVDIVLEQRPQTMGTEAVRVLYEHCNQVVEGGSMEREKDVLLEPEIITAWNESVTEPYISGELSWHVY